MLQDVHRMLQEAGKSPSFIQREMNKQRKKAGLDVLHLAHAGKVRTGKVSNTSLLACQVRSLAG